MTDGFEAPKNVLQRIILALDVCGVRDISQRLGVDALNVGAPTRIFKWSGFARGFAAMMSGKAVPFRRALNIRGGYAFDSESEA